MVRPNSKYFAGVITKFIDAKRRENIVIDESFKARLREDIVVRAASGSHYEQVDKPIFGDFFRRWRYALALVPSALVVMVVAAQFMNMPVSIESEQVVSTGTSKFAEKITKSESSDIQASVLSEDEVVQELVEKSERPESNLKTFPGALIVSRQIESVSTVDAVDYGSTQPSTTRGNFFQPDVSYDLFEFYGDVPENNVNFQVDDNGRIRADGVLTKLDVDQSVDQPTAESLTQEDSVLETYEQVLPTSQQQETVGLITEFVQRVQEDVVFQELHEEELISVDNRSIELPQTENFGALNIESTLQQYQDLGGNLAVLVPEVTSLFAISYSDLFLDFEEKASLESDVIPFIVNDREVDSVEVSECAEGDVLVRVTFVDGLVTEKCLKYNTETYVWDNVESVIRYYYDDSFRYKTRFQYQLR